ncbi:hypothetical protein DFJ74DRAFT_655368 [Hyaloraphidium curvatum]|nr:hypothetical protein DFJ74DRAFT_655368 [Hyaloraphidium curvatum]
MGMDGIPVSGEFTAKALRVRALEGPELSARIARAPRQRVILQFAKRTSPLRDPEATGAVDAPEHAPWLPAKVLLLALEPRADAVGGGALSAGTDHLTTIDGRLFRFHALDPDCPHAGGELELGDIEDIVALGDDGSPAGTEPVILCPLHLFDFSLRTGTSSVSTSKASVYGVRVDGPWIEVSGLWWGARGAEFAVWWDLHAREVYPHEGCLQ